MVDRCTAIVPLLIFLKIKLLLYLPCAYLLGEKKYVLKCYKLKQEYEVQLQYYIALQTIMEICQTEIYPGIFRQTYTGPVSFTTAEKENNNCGSCDIGKWTNKEDLKCKSKNMPNMPEKKKLHSFFAKALTSPIRAFTSLHHCV